ncbi:HPr(Ser) kinase/phosphatase [Endomicrobium proavitum]|uniref:HPr kinase/phosphorylase n=1 Tax=Endomicrobium proavitum TaxID=1408281 RepID=A0A0G3WFT2_9BACT|nr:HPr(Ser) kinase/phosphatase [Endomicrobium proavitum]AKL97466.1 serine/threonine protein kinase/phosphorylase [Endomicrobium proavitum]
MAVLDVGILLNEKSEELKLELVAGKNGLNKKITVADISRPGLAFSGYFEHFPYERTQVIGISEYTYLNSLDYGQQLKMLHKIFSHPNATCCILTRGLEPTKAMFEELESLQIPLIKTSLNSSSLISDLIYYFDGKLAPTIKIHGVLINVYGLGVLIMGHAGIGKSECALELVKRGHMLVADDMVNIKKMSGRTLLGSGLEITKHLIEVRGVGIIDVKSLFGIGSILDESHIEYVIKLEEWDKVKKTERVGMDELYTEILGVNVPEIIVPVGPGRNLAVLVETATLNQRLKNKGYFTAKELSARLQKAISQKNGNE